MIGDLELNHILFASLFSTLRSRSPSASIEYHFYGSILSDVIRRRFPIIWMDASPADSILGVGNHIIHHNQAISGAAVHLYFRLHDAGNSTDSLPYIHGL